MPLDIESVLQPQRPELVLGQFADEKAARLVAKLRDAFVDEALIEGVVAIHGVPGRRYVSAHALINRRNCALCLLVPFL